MYIIEQHNNEGIIKLNHGMYCGEFYKKNGKIILGSGILALTNSLSIIVNYKKQSPNNISFPDYKIPYFIAAKIGLLYRIPEFIKYQFDKFENINPNTNEFIIISALIFGNIREKVIFKLLNLIRINNNLIKTNLLNINNDDPVNKYKWIFIGPETNILLNIIINNDFIYDNEIDNIYIATKYAICENNIYKIVLGIKYNNAILPIYILNYQINNNINEYIKNNINTSEIYFFKYIEKNALLINYGNELCNKSVNFYLKNLRC